MMKKFLMITLYLALGYQAKGFYAETAITRAPASEAPLVKKTRKTSSLKNICTIQAGDVGKLKYKGKSYEEAFSRVTDECFQRRTQLFVKSRKSHPDQDRQIQFAESCVNAVKCI